MSRITGKLCLGLIALALGGIGTAGAAEPYPTRPIRLVVGFGAGGPTDIPARFVADKLGPLLGQNVVVENKPAAGGLLATRYVLGQPRDGYTLLLCTHFESMNTVLYKNPGYNLGDISPISLISKYYYGLAASYSIPAESFRQFVQYAKSHPGEVNYATVGVGSPTEILVRQMEKSAGITMNKIPFRGTPQIYQELMAGRVHFFVSPTLTLIPMYQTRKIRILAVTSPERLKDVPDVPTLTEQGGGFKPFGWLGICAAAGTPQPAIDLVNRHVAAIVAMPEYRDLIVKGGSIPISSTPAELGQVLTQTVDAIAATVREFGMQREE